MTFAATGQLLGLDQDRVLEVTHSFPFPHDDEDEETGAEYQMDMMRCLRDVNVDSNTVGWSVCVCVCVCVRGLMPWWYNLCALGCAVCWQRVLTVLLFNPNLWPNRHSLPRFSPLLISPDFEPSRRR